MVARRAHPGRGGEAWPGGDGGVVRSDTRGRDRKGGVVRSDTPGRRCLYGRAHAHGSAGTARASGGDGMLTSGPGPQRRKPTDGSRMTEEFRNKKYT
jgi:hypothetical protein